MADLDLEELERVARAATPGPWTKEVSVHSNGMLDAHFAVRTVDKMPDHPWSPRFITFMTGTLRSDLRVNDIKGAKYCRECETWHLGWSREIGVDVRADAKAEADATFIAAFDPPTVLSLLQALKEANAAREEAAKYLVRLEMALRRDDLDMKLDFDEPGPCKTADRICPGFDSVTYEIEVSKLGGQES